MIKPIGRKFIYTIGPEKYLLKIVNSNGRCHDLLDNTKHCFGEAKPGHCSNLQSIGGDCCDPNKPTTCFILIKSKL
jgi:hypothetical protein